MHLLPAQHIQPLVRVYQIFKLDAKRSVRMLPGAKGKIDTDVLPKVGMRAHRSHFNEMVGILCCDSARVRLKALKLGCSLCPLLGYKNHAAAKGLCVKRIASEHKGMVAACQGWMDGSVM